MVTLRYGPISFLYRTTVDADSPFYSFQTYFICQLTVLTFTLIKVFFYEQEDEKKYGGTDTFENKKYDIKIRVH
jgi:hypothetical protein